MYTHVKVGAAYATALETCVDKLSRQNPNVAVLADLQMHTVYRSKLVMIHSQRTLSRKCEALADPLYLTQ